MSCEQRVRELREENELLNTELLDLQRFLNALNDLAEATEASRYESQVHQLLSRIIGELVRAVGAEDGSLLASDPDTGELVFVLVTGKASSDSLLGRRLPPKQGIAAWVFERRTPVIVNNAKTDERFYGEIDTELGYDTRSLLAAPLVGGGKVLGVVEVLNKSQGQFFSTGNQALMNLMCRFAGELLHSMVRDLDLTHEDFRLLSRSQTAAAVYG